MFLSYDIVEAFALKRNPEFSFPFLKENGELLGIAVDAGFLVEPRGLELYRNFYDNALKLTQSYPQYYRFTLGMVVDLEKAGMRGQVSRDLANYVMEEELVLFDTSDTRRLEALTLLSHVDRLKPRYTEAYKAVLGNIDQLISRPDWYTKFNKPLFYDLTHIIFFLTNNGSQDLPLENDVYPCLMNMGLLALLDNDADLLAEICICLQYINRPIPSYWDDFLQDNVGKIKTSYSGTVASALNSSVDEYHIYLVLNWYEAMQNRPSFKTDFKSRTPSFSLVDMPQSLLSRLANYSHARAFNNTGAAGSLSEFHQGLTDVELSHLKNIMKSSHMSDHLISSFSGLQPL